MSVAHSLQAAMVRAPQAPALVFEGRTWTFASLWEASSAPAAELARRGLGRHDRIGLLVGNRPEWLFWHVAISRLGAVSVPINPAYTPAEIENVLAAADLALLLVDRETASAPRLELAGCPVVDIGEMATLPAGSHDWRAPYGVDDESPAVILFSSGSTGQPKGIVHSSRSLERVSIEIGKVWNYGPGDTLLLSMPLAFVYASVVGWLSGAKRGACCLLQRRFNADEVVAAIGAGHLTVLLGVPGMYRSLVQAAADADLARSRLRVGLTAGDVLPRDLDEQFFARFRAPLLDIYGLTETPHTVSHFVGVDSRTRPMSCGRTLPGVETRIVDESDRDAPPGAVGELLCRTPFTFLGYYRNQVATDAVLQDGWFRTGDLVRQDEDGYLYIVDRKKELIKRSGFNILPSEVEAVVLTCPGVLEAAVVGAPDPIAGEKVVAFIVAASGQSPPTRDAVATRCRAALARYKVPEDVVVVDALPKGATGKLNRKMLRQMARGEA